MEKEPKKLQLITKDDLDVDMMAEAELARLQRQYRIMEGDRAAYVEETSIKLAKQRKVIDALRKEHEALGADHRVASSKTNRTKDERRSKNVDKLLSEHGAYCEKIAREKANLKEIDYQIRKLEKQVFVLRPKEITDLQCRDRIKSGRKAIETLENALDNNVKRFCATLAENRRVREQIDHLLIEREQFNSLYEKKLRALEAGKRLLLDLVERATLAYDQREEWCNKLSALHARTHNDTLAHNREMRELQRRLDRDAGLHDFLQVKGQRRVMRDLELKERRKRELEEQRAEAELQSCRETLERIKALTGEPDPERLAGRYLKQEEENFALFNYVNELNAELEELAGAIVELRREIGEQRELNELRARQQRKTVASLEAELEVARKEVGDARSGVERAESELGGFLEEIRGLFVVLGCDEGPVLELLGGDAQISNNNVSVYLELIGRRINEILDRAMLA